MTEILDTVNSVGPEEMTFEAQVDAFFTAEVRAIIAESELTQRFPRELIERLGAAGILRSKWGDRAVPDLAKLNTLALALGRLGNGGVSVGLSLHDSAIAVLRRFGKTPYLAELAESAVDGRNVLCMAASEVGGGSDLQQVETIAEPSRGGYTLRGHKKYASLSPVADHVLVVARTVDPSIPQGRAGGNIAVLAVPISQVTVGEPYRKVGNAALTTAPIEFDTWVGPDSLVARPGVGIFAISWGLAHERLSLAGQIAGACDRVLKITHARMTRRTQFGDTLFGHQALRLRMADLRTRVDMLRLALDGIAATQRSLDIRVVSGLKVVAARLGEEVTSECMHIFGGTGYLIDETPVARWWQDMKLARIGGGADEVLLELVASGMRPDLESYSQMGLDDDLR